MHPTAPRRLAITLGVLVSVCVPATAGANLLPPKTLTLPVRVASMGGYSIGAAAMAVTYGHNEATATLSAPVLLLGPNKTFRVIACLRAYSPKRAHNNRCETRALDTLGAVGATSVAAPTFSTTMGRPPSGGAWFTYVVSVSERQSDEKYAAIATSWPATNVAGASVTVPAQGATSASAPTSLGVPLSYSRPGTINSGQPDSFCADQPMPTVEPPGPGVSTEGLGPEAPAYYEVGEPTGDFAGLPPKGVMLVMHGGGWTVTGPGAVAATRADADRWRARGWRTLNITYRSCRSSVADVQWFYDRARAVWGTTLPYCAMGQSAGGHLALLLAASRAGLSCAIDLGGPTDALTLRSASTPKGGTNGPRWLYNGMVAAIGPDDLRWWSPALFPAAFKDTRVLFAVAADDPYVPLGQGAELRDKIVAASPGAYVDVLQLPSGGVPWVHAGVSEEGLRTYEERELELVAPWS